jgi:hypothetical protein
MMSRASGLNGRGRIVGFLAFFAALVCAGCSDTVSPAPEPYVLAVHIAGESAASRTALPSLPADSAYAITVSRPRGGELGSLSGAAGTGPYLIPLTEAPAAGDEITVKGFTADTQWAEGGHILTEENLAGTPVTLTVYPLMEGKGNIDLAVSFAPGMGDDAIVKAELSLYRSLDDYTGGETPSDTARYGTTGLGSGKDWTDFTGQSIETIPIRYDDIPSGNYVVRIEFFRSAGKVSQLLQAVNVCDGLATDIWVESGGKVLNWNTFPSSNANLGSEGIELDGTTIARYDPGTDSYYIYEAATSVPADKPLTIRAAEPGQVITAWLNGSTDAEKISLTKSGNDFTGTLTPLLLGVNSLVITVTAPDGLAQKTYTVEVSGNEIIDCYYTIDGKNYGIGAGVEPGSGSITGNAIAITVPYGKERETHTQPLATHSGKSIEWPPSSISFSCTVTAVDGTTRDYTVTATTAKIASVTAVNGNLTSPHGFTQSEGSVDGDAIKAQITSVEGTDSLGTAISLAPTDYSVDTINGASAGGNETAMLRVPAEKTSTGAIAENFTVYIKNDAKAITAFYFTIDGKKYGAGEGVEAMSGSINGDDITITLPYGTNIANLSPTIGLSPKAVVDPASGVAKDFTNSVNYTVTAEDGTQENYTVTVAVAEIRITMSTKLSALAFSGAPTEPVEAGASIEITVDGDVTVSVWLIKVTGPSSFSASHASNTFTAPTLPGFYSINVFATVGDIPYSGFFGLVVK